MKNYRHVAMIQCVGSRTPERPNCSRICCSVAVKNALKLKELAPPRESPSCTATSAPTALWRRSYREAREKGVRFVPYAADAKPSFRCGRRPGAHGAGSHDRGGNVHHPRSRRPLDCRGRPMNNAPLAKMLKVPLTADGFFLEAHMKLRPVDFATDGVFLAGMAHFPKTIDETISQAGAAVARATVVIAKGSIGILPHDLLGGSEPVRRVRPLRIPLPVQRHPRRGDREGEEVRNDRRIVQGCGVCSASCPQNAVTIRHFTDGELCAQIEALKDLPGFSAGGVR